MIKDFNIKTPYWLIISLFFLILTIGLVIDRINLLDTGEKVIGQVVNITSENSSCSNWYIIRGSSHDCTIFTAQVEYKTIKGTKSQINLSAGNRKGQDQLINYANKYIGESVNLIYDPKSYNKFYENSIFGVWDTSIYAFLLLIITLIYAFLGSPKKLTGFSGNYPKSHT